MKNTFIKDLKMLEVKFASLTSKEVQENELDGLESLIESLPDKKICGRIACKYEQLREEMYFGELNYLPNSLLHWIGQCGYEDKI